MKLARKVRLAAIATAGTAGGLLTSAQFALAQAPTVGTIGSIPVPTDTSLTNIINSMITIILIVAGILAVMYLVYGGIIYITAGGDAEKAGKGRTAITNAIIGIVIIVASFAIYNAAIKIGRGEAPDTYDSPTDGRW